MSISSRLAAHRADNGDHTAAAALARIMAGRASRSADPTPAVAACPSAAGAFTQADIDRAVAQAVAVERNNTGRAIAAERARIAKVFGSEASKGRERMCATLLASPKGFAADDIIAELPGLSTGSAGAGTNVLRKCALVQGSGDPTAMRTAAASWDKVYGDVSGTGGR